jgi:hypothetical protein
MMNLSPTGNRVLFTVGPSNELPFYSFLLVIFLFLFSSCSVFSLICLLCHTLFSFPRTFIPDFPLCSIYVFL